MLLERSSLNPMRQSGAIQVALLLDSSARVNQCRPGSNALYIYIGIYIYMNRVLQLFISYYRNDAAMLCALARCSDGSASSSFGIISLRTLPMVLSDVPQATHTSPSLTLLYSENNLVAGLSIRKTATSSKSDDAKASERTLTPYICIRLGRSLRTTFRTHAYNAPGDNMVTTERHIAAYMWK